MKTSPEALRRHADDLANRDRRIAALREALEPFALLGDKFRESPPENYLSVMVLARNLHWSAKVLAALQQDKPVE